MRHIFSFVLLTALSVAVMAQQGLTCDNPIPVDRDYNGSVPAAGTYYFAAWTYDLPLQVFFTPVSPNQTVRPTVEVDFTCTPGYYEDRKIDSIVHEVSEWNIEIPMRFTTDLVERDGRNDFSLSISKTYREQLARFGVTYNVQAFVKVTFPEAGGVHIVPDTAFQSCMQTAKHVVLDDTIQVQPNDSDHSYIFPYTDWQNDSVRFAWSHGTHPLTVFIANAEECDFEPKASNAYVWTAITIGRDSAVNLLAADIKDAITNNGSGGLYYGKMLTRGTPGMFVVEHIPLANPPILLEYGQTVDYSANDTDQVYIFPASWEGTSFVTPTKHVFTMAVGDNPYFTFDNALRTFQYSGDSTGHSLYLSSLEMKEITDMSTDGNLYVRFRGAGYTTVTANQWTADCIANTIEIKSGEVYHLKRQSSQVYRMLLADWKGYDMTVEWAGTANLRVVIADICSPTTWSQNNENVIFYESVSRGATQTYAADRTSALNAQDDGPYVYLRLTSTNANDVIFTSAKPAEVDPEPDPCDPTDPDGPCYEPCDPTDPNAPCYEPPCDPTDPNAPCYEPCDPTDPNAPCYEPPCDPTDPNAPCYNPGPIDPVDPIDPDADGYTRHMGLGVKCHGDCDIYVIVDEETDLTLYDAAGQVLRTWHQLPGEANRTVITTVVGQHYTLKDSKHASISLTR